MRFLRDMTVECEKLLLVFMRLNDFFFFFFFWFSVSREVERKGGIVGMTRTQKTRGRKTQKTDEEIIDMVFEGMPQREARLLEKNGNS